ncbi:hypothetical protein FCULG_00012788 [Fusarium culmorum]|uniref:Uncharacterized protein n=1 Tax=Fusarium culmorum TaxID=5516 RepID=A0A2T4GJ05_FUSCU|nr:hypothetical protein FCULG_00012788 [Fusarium culmorum]
MASASEKDTGIGKSLAHQRTSSESTGKSDKVEDCLCEAKQIGVNEFNEEPTQPNTPERYDGVNKLPEVVAQSQAIRDKLLKISEKRRWHDTDIAKDRQSQVSTTGLYVDLGSIEGPAIKRKKEKAEEGTEMLPPSDGSLTERGLGQKEISEVD